MNYYNNKHYHDLNKWKIQKCNDELTNEEIIQILTKKCIETISNYEKNSNIENIYCKYKLSEKKTFEKILNAVYKNI
tara:strand:- start:81 stop:311 length:231 start_codon:yes stop_codon:yes gene_type:complete